MTAYQGRGEDDKNGFTHDGIVVLVRSEASKITIIILRQSQKNFWYQHFFAHSDFIRIMFQLLLLLSCKYNQMLEELIGIVSSSLIVALMKMTSHTQKKKKNYILHLLRTPVVALYSENSDHPHECWFIILELYFHGTNIIFPILQLY